MIQAVVRCKKCLNIWNVHTKGADPYCLDCGNNDPSQWDHATLRNGLITEDTLEKEIEVKGKKYIVKGIRSLENNYELTIQINNQRTDITIPAGMIKWLANIELSNRFEYRVENTSNYLTQLELNNFAMSGWELVSESRTTYHKCRTVLKRKMS